MNCQSRSEAKRYRRALEYFYPNNDLEDVMRRSHPPRQPVQFQVEASTIERPVAPVAVSTLPRVTSAARPVHMCDRLKRPGPGAGQALLRHGSGERVPQFSCVWQEDDPMSNHRKLRPLVVVGLLLSTIFVGSRRAAACTVAPAECNGRWEYDHTEVEFHLACTDTTCDPPQACTSGGSLSSHCTPYSELVDIYRCVEYGSPGGGGGGAGGLPSPQPQDPLNPKDVDDNGSIDCWRQTVDTDEQKKNLSLDQKLGSAFGGPNTQRPCHTGIDIDCNEGDPVYAAHGGSVADVGDKGTGNGGNVVFIEAAGYFYDHLHLRDILPSIRKGGTLKAGDLIGHCGHSGGANTNHLHVRITREGSGPNADCPDAGNYEFKDPEVEFPCP